MTDQSPRAFARRIDGVWTLLTGAFVIPGAGNEIAADPGAPEGPTRMVAYDRVFPETWLAASTEAERASFEIFEVAPAELIAPGYRPTADEPAIVDDGGLPRFEWPQEPVALADAQAQALAQLAGDRWLATRFFIYDGVRTQADGAIAVLTGIVTLRRELGVPGGDETTFKLADGEFRRWSLAGLLAFGAAVSAHIQACFDIEEQATTDIMAANTAAAALAIPAGVDWP